MREWQKDVLFAVGILGLLVMLFGKRIGIEVEPEVVTVFGTMLAFLYTQKQDNKKKSKKDKEGEEE